MNSNLLQTINELQSQLAHMKKQFRREYTDVVDTSVPLERPSYNKPPHRGYPPTHNRREDYQKRDNYSKRDDYAKRTYSTQSLGDVLVENEKVDLQVIVGKNSDQNVYSVATCLFNGTELTVTESKDAEKLVGKSSTKPGELLYAFIDELLENGLLTRKFNVAPWKLCYVERDSTRYTLEELRSLKK